MNGEKNGDHIAEGSAAATAAALAKTMKFITQPQSHKTTETTTNT